ncbi:SpoIIE family protein phosphatase [Streptomyces sp. NPDC046915]|uniref:ATP-binding SpoIIE family protein phosphatase n=1 Tax=Streptomyces sp. NPDC046915 TaxID=3155257 RepID=UPI00340E1927
MTAGISGRAGRAEGLGSARLRLLETAAGDQPDAVALPLALQQATAGLHGLGGLLHHRDPGGTGPLRLVALSGLPLGTVGGWARIGQDADAPPARAVRGGEYVWLGEDVLGIGAAGVVSVPLPGRAGPVGALTVLTAEPGEPDPARRRLLHAVAGWASGRLGAGPALGGTGTGTGPDPVVRALDTMADGFLTVDEDWRITFLNRAAERHLGVGGAALGSTLWDVPAGHVRAMECHCRRASAERAPLTFDLSRPGDRRVSRVRLVPLPESGLAIFFADVTPQRIDEETAGERGAAERTARVGELTVALTEAVSSRDVVRVVAEHVLPPFGADGLVVERLEGGRVRVVDSVGYGPDFLSLIDGIPLGDNTAVSDALRTRTPMFVESKAQFRRQYGELRGVTVKSTKNAWAFLPLIASGRPIGCCVMSFARQRSFSQEERTLLTAVSGLVAQALERARLYDMEHTRAQGLQRGLLPKSLPSPPAVSAAARYLPAGRGDEVGGDWYDLIPLSADRVALVIGDVMGHGIAEAATMGRLRTAVRTLVDLELEPDELLGHLNEIVGELGDDYYATFSYAVYDPVARTCALALAGHPPPVVVHPDGTVRRPEVSVNPPLGAAEPPFDVHEVDLPEESLLVFCTDGLVDAAGRDIDEGLAQLRRTLEEAVARTSYFPDGRSDERTDRLEALCDHLVATLLPDREQTSDDAALLIAHTRATPPGDVAWCSLPQDPRAAGQAREFVRRRLAAWGLEELEMTTELLVSELVGNVVRHARGPVRLRLLHSRSLICEVYDGSLTTPRIRRAGYTDEGGRGLHLVAALSQRWGTRFLGDGKCIWTEQDLPSVSRAGTDHQGRVPSASK